MLSIRGTFTQDKTYACTKFSLLGLFSYAFRMEVLILNCKFQLYQELGGFYLILTWMSGTKITVVGTVFLVGYLFLWMTLIPGPWCIFLILCLCISFYSSICRILPYGSMRVLSSSSGTQSIIDVIFEVFKDLILCFIVYI